MTNLLKTDKPQTVYDKLKNKYDEVTRPRGLQQIRDRKKNDKPKSDSNHYRKNVADHIAHLDNLVSDNDPFVRATFRTGGKTPCVILYLDEQMTDVKNLCCTGQTVLGVDKTFNLCDMHVTVSCFKNLSVVRHDTGQNPIFFGPMLIHDSSDLDTYSAFFAHLRIKLRDTDLTRLVIGTDDEQALKRAITETFHDSTHVLCTRHLKQNVIDKLTNDIGLQKTDRQSIIDQIFGKDGITDADDTVDFDGRCDALMKMCQNVSPEFQTYFRKRMIPILSAKVNEPKRAGLIESSWTNNNCESANHMLKQLTDWKSKPLLDFVDIVHENIQVQYKELRRSLIGTGRFRLADTHYQFETDKTRWAGMTNDERQRLINRFRSHMIVTKGTVTTTDGLSTFKSPRTLGKKPGQRKRKRTERTVSLKKIKTEISNT